jgi:hypothetical protein
MVHSISLAPHHQELKSSKNFANYSCLAEELKFLRRDEKKGPFRPRDLAEHK